MSRQWTIGCLVLVTASGSAFAAPAAETARSIEGVRAVEAHWKEAFLSGDSAYLESLLDPTYVSVGHSGNARPKAEIIALSKKIAAQPKSPQGADTPSTIVVHDNAAIVTATGGGDTSVDVFYYADGRWHAWYSQHTPVKSPA